MKSKTLKQILATTVLTSTLLITSSGLSNAGLQANQNTQYTQKTDTPVNWIRNIRKMESTGGAMGLNETLASDLKPSSGSNGIDVHMMKTTEYGAIAILSASGYGNPSNDRVITTTTGNNTGIILDVNFWEWTAGGLNGWIFSQLSVRYYDTYDSGSSSNSYPAKPGDALGNATSTNPGCMEWHSNGWKNFVNSSSPYFARGYGGIYSFANYSDTKSYMTRGVAVCGTGF